MYRGRLAGRQRNAGVDEQPHSPSRKRRMSASSPAIQVAARTTAGGRFLAVWVPGGDVNLEYAHGCKITGMPGKGKVYQMKGCLTVVGRQPKKVRQAAQLVGSLHGPNLEINRRITTSWQLVGLFEVNQKDCNVPIPQNG